MSDDHKWLNLVEVSGPFLATPVLRDVFPQGFEAVSPSTFRRLRLTYEEWRDAVDMSDSQLRALHTAWIDEVLGTALEMDADVLRRGLSMPSDLEVVLPEHGMTVAPDIAVVDPTQGDSPFLLIHVYQPDMDLDVTRRFEGFAVTPVRRMVSLLRATGCFVGIITNGERWILVHAPVGSVVSLVSWYARLWAQEQETLQAFINLLGVRRFFGPDTEKLPALFERSLKHQDDVTETLGEQVRRAVEVLVQTLDRIDQDRNQDLLRDVGPRELYEACLTFMMRLVFLLAAEERELLLLGDPRYDRFYAASSLRMQLRAESEEILERRHSAWSRLLALFRGVYGGIDHPELCLPALGGSLFDPDRYPFLEGRKKGTSWKIEVAEPLPVDDRTVLLLLEAIQIFEGRTLSYRALDVEQIGHVYEGLLERMVKRVDDVTLELGSSTKIKNPRVTRDEISSANLDGLEKVIKLLKERSGRSESTIRNALERPPDDSLAERLLTACRGDIDLRDFILPYGELLRTDPWGYPLVRHAGAFVVMLGADRRESGTHYTPKNLTEKIVEEALTPVVYRGPEQGKVREEWKLKNAEELLDLKICDPAMGSGAFLVQVCSWLSDRLVEAWLIAEESGRQIDCEGYILNESNTEGCELLSKNAEERVIFARRLIAERCLYGVDGNPLAVELAKLSLWLTTMSKGRPFGFLDHNLRSGDSLLGVRDLNELIRLEINSKNDAQIPVFGQMIGPAVEKALKLRAELRTRSIRDIRDIDAMAALDHQSREKLALSGHIADAFVGIVFSEKRASSRTARISMLAALSDVAMHDDERVQEQLVHNGNLDLAKDAPNGVARRPFHWPLEFPEVFVRKNGGFDCIVGNPPFLGGKRIKGVAGEAYRNWLVQIIAEGRVGSADLVAYFFLRAHSLLRDGASFGLLAVNTIAEGETRQVGLEAMLSAGAVIYSALPSEPWPGSASVTISCIHMWKGQWDGQKRLSDMVVDFISAFLSKDNEWTPKKLYANFEVAFGGSALQGAGFVLTDQQAQSIILESSKSNLVIFPYLNGEDLNSESNQCATRHVINFWDWDEESCKQYQLVYNWIYKKVKPERQRLKSNGEYKLRRPLPQRWWQHGDICPGLYHAIGFGEYFKQSPTHKQQIDCLPERVFVCSQTSKFLIFAAVSPRQIFSKSIVIFASDKFNLFAFLSSSINEVWARKNSSSFGTGLRYTPSSAFETLPLPDLSSKNISDIGCQYEKHRSHILCDQNIGLTDLYNRFHDHLNLNQAIQELRTLHKKMDIMIAHSYGWKDIQLGHDFYEVPYLPADDRMRFTISEEARLEVLRRLAEMNSKHYQAEVSRGLHDKASGRRKGGMRRPRDTLASDPTLNLGNDQTRNQVLAGGCFYADVLEYLRRHPGWHTKSDILAAVNLPENQWSTTIRDLLTHGIVERCGKRRGTRYKHFNRGENS